MSNTRSNLHSTVYNNFKEIDSHAHQSIVEFYHRHESDIQRLKFDEYFELQISYIDALFEIAAYDNLLSVCDTTIETVIINNIQTHRGEDIYRKLLLKKAAVHYNLLEYYKTEYILKELIKINPNDTDTIRFLTKCQTYRVPYYVRYTRNVSLLFFFFTALVICFEMLKSGFYSATPSEKLTVEIIRNTIFLSGWFVLLLGDGIFRYSISKKTNHFVEQIKKSKKNELRVTNYELPSTSITDLKNMGR